MTEPHFSYFFFSSFVNSRSLVQAPGSKAKLANLLGLFSCGTAQSGILQQNNRGKFDELQAYQNPSAQQQ
jgi:hypothetical protein